MKFLVDRCAGRSLADWLGSEGHDSLYAVSLGPDPGDRALLQKAVSEERILVTIDTDFGKLVFRGGEVHCGIVRLPDVRRERRIELMKRVIERYGLQLERGAMITVRGGNIRVSLP
jgi:predicted nuclease of predicted toxin-antitoxin system